MMFEIRDLIRRGGLLRFARNDEAGARAAPFLETSLRADGEAIHVSARRLFALIIVLFTLVALPAFAADLRELVDQLGSDDFAKKQTAVEALGALGDGKAVAALKALAEGNLYTTVEKRAVIAEPAGDGWSLTDPVTGERSEAGKDDIEKVRVNNRLRGAIDAALGRLTLFSAKREERLAAAREAIRHPTREGIAPLAQALEKESDGEIRQALGRALATAQLSAGSKREQLAAVADLASSSNPEIRSLLTQQLNTPDLDPELKRALESALRQVNGRLQLIGFAENVFQGLSLGSVLLLAAIGLAITFGVMGVINMAHGEMIMLGAYSAYVAQEIFRAFLPPAWIDAYLLVAVPFGFVVAGLAGILIERAIIRFLYGRPLETMLATWGVSLVLQQLVRSIFGAPNKEVANPSWMTGAVELMGGAAITWNRIIILVFCFAVLGALALTLRRTRFGLHMRAVTQNREMASVMGIATARLDALAFGLGSGIAGMAGVALSQIGNVSPNLGQIYIVDSFLVVVFGGVGNLLGTLVGAMTLGIVNKLLEPVAGAVLGKIAVLLFIILFIQKRPRGLFALKGRAAEG
jgi:urea transport system permease protein